MGRIEPLAFGRLNALAPATHPDVVEPTQYPNIDRDSGEKEQKDHGSIHVLDMGLQNDPIKEVQAQC